MAMPAGDWEYASSWGSEFGDKKRFAVKQQFVRRRVWTRWHRGHMQLACGGACIQHVVEIELGACDRQVVGGVICRCTWWGWIFRWRAGVECVSKEPTSWWGARMLARAVRCEDDAAEDEDDAAEDDEVCSR